MHTQILKLRFKVDAQTQISKMVLVKSSTEYSVDLSTRQFADLDRELLNQVDQHIHDHRGLLNGIHRSVSHDDSNSSPSTDCSSSNDDEVVALDFFRASEIPIVDSQLLHVILGIIKIGEAGRVLCTLRRQLLGVGKEEVDFTLNGTSVDKIASNRSKKASKGTNGLSLLDSRLTKGKTSGESSKKKKRDKDKTSTYVAQPVSFLSCGTMALEPVASVVTIDDSKPKDRIALPSSYGAFEMHTTCFGSRMMAKMGYVDGGGMGKDGRGIA
ncbi:hypothetical protein L6452_21907 [Arctium lappa]|uniref:Uncharacterized protein n=1 Tax=Arctium lappa TaxID=4217 RepID=A0ACB9AZ83_ARCLA|nr:hypothetical protein L6452_21907 [Arctium lappa]